MEPGTRRLPLVVALAALAVQAPLAVLDLSIYYPDEIFQLLEPAHRAAFGYGQVAWEWRDGLRSWLAPGVVAGLFRLLGGADGAVLVVAARLLVVALSVAGVVSAALFARRRGGDAAALVAAALCIGFPPLYLVAYRTLSEPIAASLWMIIFLLLDDKDHRRHAALAGILGGLSVFVRFQAGVLLVAAGLVLVAQRRWRDLLAYGIAAAVMGVLGALLDWVTWGAPLASFVEYVRFNFVQDGAVVWGARSTGHYLLMLERNVGLPLLVVLGVAFLAGVRRAPALALVAAVFCALHVATPHKELRFLVPVMPLVMVVAALGVAELLRRFRPAVALALAVLVAGAFLAVAIPKAHRVRYDDLDYHSPLPIIGTFADLHRAVARAGTLPETCGVIVAGPLRFWPGYSFLHRDVPLVYADTPEHRALANTIVTEGDAPGGGYQRVRRLGKARIYRREGSCIIPPGWTPPSPADRPTQAQIDRARARR